MLRRLVGWCVARVWEPTRTSGTKKQLKFEWLLLVICIHVSHVLKSQIVERNRNCIPHICVNRENEQNKSLLSLFPTIKYTDILLEAVKYLLYFHCLLWRKLQWERYPGYAWVGDIRASGRDPEINKIKWRHRNNNLPLSLWHLIVHKELPHVFNHFQMDKVGHDNPVLGNRATKVTWIT